MANEKYVAALNEFFHHCIQATFYGEDLNGCDVQKTALSMGLLTEDPGSKHNFLVVKPEEFK